MKEREKHFCAHIYKIKLGKCPCLWKGLTQNVVVSVLVNPDERLFIPIGFGFLMSQTTILSKTNFVLESRP